MVATIAAEQAGRADKPTRIGPSSLAERAYPTWLETLEKDLVQKRRAVLGKAGVDGNEPQVGLALSGGGIRSATFALGVLQGLARHRLLHEIDYLSTVSGGGYAGSFWGGLHVPLADREIGQSPAESHERGPARSALEVEEMLGAEPHEQGFPLWWLRRNGRYLSPVRKANLLMGAILLRNWLSVLVNLLVPIVVLVLAGALGRTLLPAAFHEPIVRAYLWWSPFWLLPILFLALTLPIGAAYWMVPARQAGMKISTRLTALSIAFFALLLARWGAMSEAGEPVQVSLVAGWTSTIPSLGIQRGLFWILVAIAAVAVVALAISAISIRRRGGADQGSTFDIAKSRHRLTVWLKALLVCALVSAAVATVDTFGQTCYAILAAPDRVDRLGWAAVVLAPAAWVVTSAPRLLSSLGSKSGPVKLSLFRDFLITIGGLFVAFLFAVSAATLAHALAWRATVPGGDPGGMILNEVTARAADEAAREKGAGKTSAPVVAQITPARAAVAASSSASSSLRATWLMACLGPLILVAWMFSQARPFLNQSSLSWFYASRLTRAFLGASNPRRENKQGGAGGDLGRRLDPTEVVAGDDIALTKYQPHRMGGPLHLINTSLNETRDARSSTEERDRKALPLAVGPAAISVGVLHHGRIEASQPDPSPKSAPRMKIAQGVTPPQGEFSLFGNSVEKPIEAEALTVGQWIAISGAAVATGLGSLTSLGASLLTGLFNLRLGYWWFSGTEPYAQKEGRAASRRLGDRVERLFARTFPVLAHLLDELTARFHGTGRRNWYLTDGGHFENTGCYELIRRRLPFIICSDAGADAEYGFTDLANLVRKARIDFGAEVEFLEGPELDLVGKKWRPYFGSLEQLNRIQWRGERASDSGQPHAALARITYAKKRAGGEPDRGLLLVLKPTLCGREPLDVREYAASHLAFPHESTGDQFFDEAQWESYRRLGEHIAHLIFSPRPSDDPSTWWPASLKALP